MDKTVQPDKKLMADTSIRWNVSRAGFIITPPPIPQIAPATDAKKQITKKMNEIIISPLACLFFFLQSTIRIAIKQ